MSSDNGIYILKTQGPKVDGRSTGDEHRVAHVTGIDNIYYNVNTGKHEDDFVPQEAFRCFGDCKVFDSYDEALVYAHQLEHEHSILEYGVLILHHENQVFVPFSEEELEFHKGEVDDIIERHRQKRDAETAAKLEAATVSVTPEMSFETGNIYGYLVKEDGSKVHGSLKGVTRIFPMDRTDLEFLPSDWNK